MTSIFDAEDDQEKKRQTIESSETPSSSSKLMVFDRTTKKDFLSDSGADLSVIPPQKNAKRKPDDTIITGEWLKNTGLWIKTNFNRFGFASGLHMDIHRG